MGQLSDRNPGSGRRVSVLRVSLGVLVGVTILTGLMSRSCPPLRRPRRVVCLTNLKILGLGMNIYAEEHGGAYPPADKWCDLLVPFISLNGSEGAFTCPKAGEGRCHYAMNARADTQSAPDVVLLFESTGGWNQSGGSEMLTTRHLDGKGCNVLFVDGHVEFIKTEEIPRLKWKDQGTLPSEKRDE
jgi:prepilin-type processing-associated H-X9-DG protein